MALIGAAPTEEQKQRLIAQLLSGRRSVGQLGAISGDRQLAPFGANMVNQADRYAEQLQQIRQNDIDDKRTQGYYDGQLGHMGRTASETERHNKELERLRGEEIAAGLEEARIRAETGPGSRRKMTDSTRNGIRETLGAYEGAKGLYGTFKDEYVQKYGAGPQSLLPNYAAQYGLTIAPGAKEAQNWWAAWQELRTLPERNRLFGATLTDNERREWTKADINAAMGPEQVKTAVLRIMKIMQDKARQNARIMMADGFDAEDIELAYGDILYDDLESLIGEGDEGPAEDDEAIAELEARIKAQMEAENGNQP